MRHDSRPYFVCKGCQNSWIFCHKAAAVGSCKVCGSRWPKVRKPQEPQQRVWKSAGEEWVPPRQTEEWVPPRSRPQQGKAHRALTTVWEHLPANVQASVQQAGWQPQSLDAPPGLPTGKGKAGKDRTVTHQGGAGKGKGASKATGAAWEPEEAVKALFESASDHQKELLVQCGFTEPEEPQPDLIEMCKKHVSALPPAIRELVEEPPEKPPSAFEQLNDTSKKFKTATVELRELIMKKASLQLKINKHKEVYTGLLNDMKSIDSNLTAKQEQVTLLQQQLQSSVVAEVHESRLDIETALCKQIDTMPLDQLEAFKERFCVSIEEKASRKRQAAPPDSEMPAAGTDASELLSQTNPPPPGQVPAGKGDVGKPRSRSRGRNPQA